MRRLLSVLLPLLILLFLLPQTGLAGSASISGHAWLDGGSGVYTENARALGRTAVTLFRVNEDGSEAQVEKLFTDQDGAYSFTGLDAGTYRLRAVLPADHQFILPRQDGSIMLPNAGGSSFSMPLSLAEGAHIENAHIGASKSSCYIKAIVFEDLNQNGGRSENETLLRGVEVTLLYEMNGEWVEVASVKSDQDGDATFWKLTPGTYRVAASLPAPYIIGPLGSKISVWYNSIPPCDSGYGMSEPVKVERGTSLGVGVGTVSTGSVEGMLWDDADSDGRKSAGEGGFAGAAVRLFSTEAGVSREMTTDASGAYRFEGLLAGTYTLEVSLPESVMFTLPGGDSLLTGGYSFTDSTTVAVEDQQITAVKPVGVMPVTSLTVQLYNDINVNGAFDGDEPVFSGALLEILVDDKARAAAVSDGEGIAYIPVLRGGECEIRLELPDGQVFTVDGDNNDFVSPSATGNLTQPITVPHAQETQLYAGVTLPASVSGVLFNDENLSGVQDGNETGMEGFTVQAVNAEGDVVAQTLTDREGHYAFSNLLPAPHTIRFGLVDAYVFTDLSESGAAVENKVASQTPEYGETRVISLTPGQSVAGVSGGMFRSATVSGQVLLRTGIDALPGEGGIEGVKVLLLDESGAEFSAATTAYTNEDGSFYLKGALPGTYQLEYVLPENAAFTDPFSDEDTMRSGFFPVNVADDLTSPALYAVYTGTLSGTLYRDINLNCALDSSDSMLAGVSLQARNTDLDITYETVTAEDGSYRLEGLRPGAYTLQMTLPDGLCFAYDAASPFPPRALGEGTAALNIGIGEELAGRNIAAAAPARVSGRVYYDLKNNGLQDAEDIGADGITLTLKSKNGPTSYTLQTGEDGQFSIAALVPGAYSLRVTLDSDCIPAEGNSAVLSGGFWTSDIAFADGEDAAPEYGILRYARVAGHVWSLDGSLNGVAGRTVSLFLQGEDKPLATAATDDQGAFEFTKLKPGSYRLTCDLPDERYNYARPADAPLRPASLPGESPDIPVGQDDFFPVAMGADMRACDIGIGAMGSLGDTAWLDLNGNGLQDGGEPNLPGIRIRLYQYGELAAETVTDSMGHYLVENLYPGLYTLQADYPQELLPTVQRSDFPLAASVLLPAEGTTAEAADIVVPSAGRNLNCDLGFVLRQEGVYPASLDELLQTDWSFNGRRK